MFSHPMASLQGNRWSQMMGPAASSIASPEEVWSAHRGESQAQLASWLDRVSQDWNLLSPSCSRSFLRKEDTSHFCLQRRLHLQGILLPLRTHANPTGWGCRVQVGSQWSSPVSIYFPPLVPQEKAGCADLRDLVCFVGA